MSKKIAFFDFDGTITTKDTLLEFIKFSKGNLAFVLGFLLNSPFLIAYKLKLISNQSAKERMLSYFFNGTPVDIFQKLCDEFAKKKIPALIREKAAAEINKLKSEGFVIVIVSASPENWISFWAKTIGANLIATKLNVQNSFVTGRIAGKNCHGQEKVKRIKDQYDISVYDDIYAYGDTTGDKPMLQLAGTAYYKPFRN